MDAEEMIMAYGYTFLNRITMKRMKVVYFPEELNASEIMFGVDECIEEISVEFNIGNEDIFYYVNSTHTP